MGLNMENHQTELIENEELCDLYRKKAEQLVLQMTIEELADQTLNLSLIHILICHRS